jgi:hypothetical protein
MPDRPTAPVTAPAAPAGAAPGHPGRPLAFHPLVFQPDGDEVTVGRMDEGTFIVLETDTAALLRRLVDGDTPQVAAAWYRATYGEDVDVAGFTADLDDLGFLRDPGATAPDAPPAPVRWSRLGRAVFSPPAAVLYALLLTADAVAMFRDPSLVPGYHQIFFTPYMSVVITTMYLGQVPLVLLHETAHALAGRRLGVPTRLTVGRRLYYVVFLTAMDGLVAVPRRKRYLPMLAGMLTDLGVLAALTLVAAALRPHALVAAAVLLGLAYTTMLRVLWQCWFFLRTDVYYLVVTVLGCVDLHGTARQVIANRWHALRRRPLPYDPDVWHPRDRRAARWYSVLVVAGYAFSLGTLVVGLLPAAVRMVGTVLARLGGHGPQGAAGLADSIVFLVLVLGEVALGGLFYLRERHQARRADAPVPS